jgi:hypothetical protein
VNDNVRPKQKTGDCKAKNETEMKRNETGRNETKRNETQQKRNKIKQKRNETNETQQKRNETKKSSTSKKNETNMNETILFYMRQHFIKCQWRIEKPLIFTGRFGYERKK